MTDTAPARGLVLARQHLDRILEIPVSGPESAQSVAARSGAAIAIAQIEIAAATQLDALAHVLDVDGRRVEEGRPPILSADEEAIVVDTIRALIGLPEVPAP